MNLLAHRGFWLQREECNSEIAFRRALEHGYGIETDLRDLDGEIVISHDMPRRGAMPLTRFFELYLSFPGRPLLALNVKADGMQAQLADALAGAGVSNYFCFDMSVPDSLGYFSHGLRSYTRWSDIEKPSPLDAKASGVWLDHFSEGYVPVELLRGALNAQLVPALVSPELHGRPYLNAWHAWHPLLSATTLSAALCTDQPNEAQAFFGSKQ